ncbi:MAG: class I lanthipeptide [Candidatus Aminicenantes bacterium]|nr:MAG: class I lanthipeptide [Candidatus Aminicenantes bacterium]
MKIKHPPKKLTLIKQTIAHLSNEQMEEALGGNTTHGYVSVRACHNSLTFDGCDTIIL